MGHQVVIGWDVSGKMDDFLSTVFGWTGTGTLKKKKSKNKKMGCFWIL